MKRSNRRWQDRSGRAYPNRLPTVNKPLKVKKPNYKKPELLSAGVPPRGIDYRLDVLCEGLLIFATVLLIVFAIGGVIVWLSR